MALFNFILTWAVPNGSVEDGLDCRQVAKLWKERVVVDVDEQLSSLFHFCVRGRRISKERSVENGSTGLVSALGISG